MTVSCECCVVSGKGLCRSSITCPERLYQKWCIIVYDLETSRIKVPDLHWAVAPNGKKSIVFRLDNEMPVDYKSIRCLF